MEKLFFSHCILDSLVEEGKIKLENTILTLLVGKHPSFEFEPACRFVNTMNNSPGPNNLVGRIKSEKEIKTMQAELYLNSVLYRDTAYEVEPGFIAEKKTHRQALG